EAPCLPSETDVDYVSKENIAERTGVKDAEACRTSCEREPRCGAWTWGTEDGPSAMVQICFLKPQDPETWRYPQAGVVSGRPCRSIQASPALDARQLRRGARSGGGVAAQLDGFGPNARKDSGDRKHGSGGRG
ncbi:unnamed protein product, partial [Prorocentrum cordatum]